MNIVRGRLAAHLVFHHGVIPLVRSLQSGWVRGDQHTKSRMARTPEWELYAYGADLCEVSNEQRCAGCR